tara:strand:- start:3633 stop:5957 length:2325 start_codon:yes stop_codon:yes gene_type:complete
MKLIMVTIIFLVGGFPVYVFSAENDSESIQNIYFSDIVDPECDPRQRSTHYLSNLQHLASVGIDIQLSQRRHTKKLLRRKLNIYNSTGELPESKGLRGTRDPRKYSDATISISGSNCNIPAKYRLTGDMSDHHHINLSSIKVKLKNGSLGDIQKFKLFVPISRSSEMEVFTTYMYRKLGFLSPRTAIVNVNLNDNLLVSRVFQEEIDESFLENNDIHESFIFRGHEDFGLMKRFSVPSIRNENLIESHGVGVLAESVLYELSQIYLSIGLDSLSASPAGYSRVDPIVNPDYFPKKSREEIKLFTVLSVAMGLDGGLTKDDSRFVYDSVSRRFRPIFYDGHSLGEIPILTGSKLIVPYRVTLEHKRALVQKLKSLDANTITQELADLGAKYSISSVDSKIDAIIHNINGLRSRQIDAPAEAKKIGINELLQNFVLGNRQQEQLFLIRLGEKLFNKCLVKVNAVPICSESNLSIDSLQLSRLLVSQQLDHISADLTNAIYIDAFHEKYAVKSSLRQIWPVELPNVEFNMSANLNLEISKEHRTIRIVIGDDSEYYEDAQVHISGHAMENWVVSSGPNILGYQAANMKKSVTNQLSGCLTFSDIKLAMVGIKISQSNCEDVVHFVRVSGVGIDLDINKAFSDGADADFSDIEFGDIKIDGAGNDCVDLSVGTYAIRTAKLSGCVDKGISAGENSSVEVSDVIINSADIGVAGKDSSDVNLDRFSISDVNFCFAAYQKKIKYLGGIINFGEGECIDSHVANVFKQKGSIVSAKTILND